jgi:hypothetical protein
MDAAIAEATRLIERLAPAGRPVAVRPPLEADESEWFRAAVTEGVVVFEDCPADCFRLKKWAASGPDHFRTPSGKPRHLFSKPVGDVAWLNREYVPHIAAYAAAVLKHGYRRQRSSFSRYRTFSRDLIVKRQGQSYETDAEFYDDDGAVHLQIEAKASAAQTERLAAMIRRHGELAKLPSTAVKEVEYVLDLRPRYLWVVGPGSVDPPSHVFGVSVHGLNAGFLAITELPPPPPPD